MVLASPDSHVRGKKSTNGIKQFPTIILLSFPWKLNASNGNPLYFLRAQYLVHQILAH